MTEKVCQWKNVVSGGARASPMCNGSGGFHSRRCGEGELDIWLHDG